MAIGSDRPAIFSTMPTLALTRSSDIPPGSVRSFRVGNRDICVANVDGHFYALRDRCPHQAAPLSKGSLGGTMVRSAPGEFTYGRDGCILRCPWHGWEFDVTTGCSLFDAKRARVKAYPVSLEGDMICIEL